MQKYMIGKIGGNIWSNIVLGILVTWLYGCHLGKDEQVEFAAFIDPLVSWSISWAILVTSFRNLIQTTLCK